MASYSEVVSALLLSAYRASFASVGTVPIEEADWVAVASGVQRIDSYTRGEELGEGLAGQAFQFYYENVEEADWGCVSVFRVQPLEGSGLLPFVLVRVSTDGDDGWVECFEERGQGRRLFIARSYLELLSEGADPSEGSASAEAIRQHVFDMGFPEGFSTEGSRALEGIAIGGGEGGTQI